MVKLINTAFRFSLMISGLSAIPLSDNHARKEKFSIAAVRSDVSTENGIENKQESNKELGLGPFDRNYSLLMTRQDGSAPATSSSSQNPWISTVTVGSQDLNLVLDTGSSDFWVFSIRQPPEQRVGHSFFDPAKSKEFIDIGNPFDVAYGGDTIATGKTGADDVIIGVTKANQVFGLAANVAGPSSGFDGIVGLGPTSGVTIGAKTFLDNARDSLTEPLFTAYLPRTGIGAYNFGEIDDTKYSGDITYADVSTSLGQWQFQSTGYKVGDISWSVEGMTGIADTGLSDMLVQPEIAVTYYSDVAGWSYDGELKAYIYPCLEALPDFSFQIGPETYVVVPGSDLNAGPLISKHMCRGRIQATSAPFNVYGIPFFYNYYAIFDAGTQEFGFATIN